MATSNSKPQQQDLHQSQTGIATNNNIWNSDVARANQQLGGGVPSVNFGLGGMNTNESGGLGRSNVMDALMIARLQQSQDQQQQHDALRRLSIDTIGSSHRSVGLDGANGLMSVAGRINNNNLLQQANAFQQHQNLLSVNNNNQFLNPQQIDLQTQLQQAGIVSGNGMGGNGLYPLSDSLPFMQNFDPSSAAVANLRLQQGLAGMSSSGMNSNTGSNLSQSLMSSNMMPGNQLDFSNSGSNPMLDVDFLYMALLQQQQQQKQQSDSLLNLQRNQQQLMSLGNDVSSRNDVSGGNAGGMTGFDNMQMSAQQNRFQQQNMNTQQQHRQLGSEQLDWSRNSESNLDATTTNTLFSLQQQQQQLQQQQQQISAMNQMNYQSIPNNRMMNLEDQFVMNNSMWNNPGSMLNLQQQNQLFSQQFQGANSTLEGDMGTGGIGSNSLLSALFAESSQPPLDLGGLSGSAVATLGNLHGNNNEGTTGLTSAGSKPSKSTEPAPQLPVRALSAYNFFFRDERERIINGEKEVDPLDPSSLNARRNSVTFNDEKKQQLLSGHWYRDRTVKRRHRKTHGKIAFTALSKVISQAWRDLPETEKAFYREVAADDLERYQRELEQHKVTGGGLVEGVPKALDASLGDSSGREPV